jgi:hypothetical protein
MEYIITLTTQVVIPDESVNSQQAAIDAARTQFAAILNETGNYSDFLVQQA